MKWSVLWRKHYIYYVSNEVAYGYIITIQYYYYDDYDYDEYDYDEYEYMLSATS